MPSLGQVIYNLPVAEKRLVRRIEKLNNKINSCDAAILFNTTCLREGLLPILLLLLLLLLLLFNLLSIIANIPIHRPWT